MKTKSDTINLLRQLVQFKENDLLLDLESGYATEKDVYHVTELVIAITRYILDIRYCSKKKCRCSPEQAIESNYEVVKDYLQKTKRALYPVPWKTIEDIISK